MRHNTRGMLSWTVTALLTVALSTGVVALTTGNTVVSSATSATTTAATTPTTVAATPTTVATTTPTIPTTQSTPAQSTTVHYTTTYHGDDNYAVLPSGTTVKSTRTYTDN